MRQKCQMASTPEGYKRQVRNQLVTTEQEEPKRHDTDSTASTPCPQCCTPVTMARQLSWLATVDVRVWVNETWENEWLWLGKINLFTIKSHFFYTRSHIEFCCSNFQQMSSAKSTAFFSRLKCKMSCLLKRRESELSVQKEALLIIWRKYQTLWTCEHQNFRY